MKHLVDITAVLHEARIERIERELERAREVLADMESNPRHQAQPGYERVLRKDRYRVEKLEAELKHANYVKEYTEKGK